MDGDSSTAKEKIFASCTTAEGVAAVLGEKVADSSAVMDEIAEIIASHLTTRTSGTFDATASKITGLDAGYYLIVPADGTTGEEADNDAVSDLLIELTDDELVITYKGQPATSEKKVKDTNDSVTIVPTDFATNTQNWQDSADYDIGDTVPFLLVANLPSASTYDDYDTYKVTFHDNMDAGFTIQQTTVQVFAGSVDSNGNYVYDNTKPIDNTLIVLCSHSSYFIPLLVSTLRGFFIFKVTSCNKTHAYGKEDTNHAHCIVIFLPPLRCFFFNRKNSMLYKTPNN